MKKIGLIVFAAFLGGAVAIGAYKLLERTNDGYSLTEKQNMMFANNPVKISSAGTVDFVQAAAAVSPAVVHIKTTYGSSDSNGQASSGDMADMFEQFFRGGGGPRQRIPRAASGSGVILTSDGYIVTNNHVVDKADKIEVILSNRRKVTAKIIGKDANTDLALLKVDVTGLPFVKMGNSDNVQVGEWVLAVGFPLDLQTTVTAGIVSAKARNIGILNRENNTMTQEEYFEMQRTGKRPDRPANNSIESFIQTDAAINPGNSGGALVNANGELVGINAAIASETGRNEGYGFAIPVNLAKKILEDFKQYGVVKRGYIGVTFQALDADVADQLKIKEINGLYVNSVLPNGGAAAAGQTADRSGGIDPGPGRRLAGAELGIGPSALSHTAVHNVDSHPHYGQAKCPSTPTILIRRPRTSTRTRRTRCRKSWCSTPFRPTSACGCRRPRTCGSDRCASTRARATG